MDIKTAKAIPLDTVLHKLGRQSTRITRGEAWYHSPFREETTESLHVLIERNIWYDFGMGKGGSVIDLIMEWLDINHQPAEAKHALAWCREHFGNTPVQMKSFNRPQTKTKSKYSETVLKFIEAKPLTHPKLYEYLQSRGIPPELGKQYLEQAHIWHREKQREYYGLAFSNDLKGIEFRNAFLKSSFGKKAPTTLKGDDKNTIHLFEGFMDFLSALAIHQQISHDSTMIVLNSLSFQPQVLTTLSDFKGQLFSWYDNDTAGLKATKALSLWVEDTSSEIHHKAMNDLYDGFDDVNAYLQYLSGLPIPPKTKPG